MSLLEQSIVVDGCAFAEGEFPGYTQRMASGSVNAVFYTVPESRQGFRGAVSSIGRIYNRVDQQPEKLRVARSAKDIEEAHTDGGTAIVLAFQDPAPMENRLELLRVFYELGARVVQLTYNKANYLGTGCAETEDKGLTDFGGAAIREMNRLGMLIDLSHCSQRTTLEAIEASEHPVVFSHANVRAISDNPRNHTDEELKRLAQKGGVVGLTPWGPICWRRMADEPPSLDDYLEHVDHVVNLVGADHVAFGTDNTLDGAADEKGTKAQSALYPSVVGDYDRRVGTAPEVRYTRGFGGHHELENVVEGLQSRGFKEGQVAQFLGGNFMRVLRAVWK